MRTEDLSHASGTNLVHYLVVTKRLADNRGSLHGGRCYVTLEAQVNQTASSAPLLIQARLCTLDSSS
jgi:hypothetical protein